MIHPLKWAADRKAAPQLTANQVVAACLYCAAFALFVCWRRFSG